MGSTMEKTPKAQRHLMLSSDFCDMGPPTQVVKVCGPDAKSSINARFFRWERNKDSDGIGEAGLYGSRLASTRVPWELVPWLIVRSETRHINTIPWRGKSARTPHPGLGAVCCRSVLGPPAPKSRHETMIHFDIRVERTSWNTCAPSSRGPEREDRAKIPCTFGFFPKHAERLGLLWGASWGRTSR